MMKFVLVVVAVLAVANANVVDRPTGSVQLPSLNDIQQIAQGILGNLRPVVPQPTLIDESIVAEPAIIPGRPSVDQIRERLRELVQRLRDALDRLPAFPGLQEIRDALRDLRDRLRPSTAAYDIDQIREKLQAVLDRIVDFVNNLPNWPGLDAIKDRIRGLVARIREAISNLRPTIVLEPTLVDDSIVNPAPATVVGADDSPLVQIIVNVNPNSAHPNPVAVVNPAAEEDSIVERPNPVDDYVKPEPVIIVDKPTPVIVVEEPAPSPIQIAQPVLPVPVAPVVLPETLN